MQSTRFTRSFWNFYSVKNGYQRENIKNQKYTMASLNADSNMAAGQAKQIQLNIPKCHTDAGPEISSSAKKREWRVQNRI